MLLWIAYMLYRTLMLMAYIPCKVLFSIALCLLFYGDLLHCCNLVIGLWLKCFEDV